MSDREISAGSLDRFLASTERRALVMAELATGNRDEALDIVQDAMFAFCRRYSAKPAAQWPPLFHRVLQNRIRDWYRRRSVRRKLFGWLPQVGVDMNDSEPDPIQQAPDPASRTPEMQAAQRAAADALPGAVAALPLRQQQAFLLRIWEGLCVADTASAMGCSQGSVKTHLSRALTSLRQQLEDHYDGH